MIRIGESIEVSRPQAQVFGFLADLNNIPEWQSEVVKSTVITPGAVKVGTRFDEVVKIGPWRVTTHCVVTEYEAGRRMAFRAESSPIRYEGRFTVESVDKGCRVDVAGTARLRGLWKLMQPALAGEIRKGVKQELAAMKQRCEMP